MTQYDHPVPYTVHEDRILTDQDGELYADYTFRAPEASWPADFAEGVIGTSVGVSTGIRAHGTCRIDPGSANRFPSMQNRGIGLDGSAAGVMVERYGSRQAVGRINAILIQPVNSTTFSGTFTLYGRRA